MRELLDNLLKINTKPLLFEPGWSLTSSTARPCILGEAKFWDDPHISKSMLEAHLNPNHDAASRKPETIDKTVKHLFESKVLKPGMKVLDLGCGPGLYAKRLCQGLVVGKACCSPMHHTGVEVVGIDMSERSIEYAGKNATEAGLKIEYHCRNFFNMDYNEEFDAVIQVYGELCTFSNEMRDCLFKLVHRALKKGGVFVFDVSTRAQRMRDGLKNGWYMSEGGFWRPGKHLVLEQGVDYPEEEVWLDQYVVIDDQGAKVYRNWFHNYSLDSINSVLIAAGFKTKHEWNDLTGSSFTEGGDWIAIGAIKEEGDENK